MQTNGAHIDNQSKANPVYRGLAYELMAVGLINLVVVIGVLICSLLKPFGLDLEYIPNGIWIGQATILGISAALVPKRGIVGLGAVLAYAIAEGYASWLILLWLSQKSSSDIMPGVLSTSLFFLLVAIAVLAILRIVRLITGLRLSVGGKSAEPSRGQVHIVDLMEWTAIVGVWLGLNLTWEGGAVRGFYSLRFTGFVCQLLFVALPIASALVAQRSLGRWTVFGLISFCLAVELGVWAGEFWQSGFFLPWSGVLPGFMALSTFLTVVVLNSLALRQLGLRWHCDRQPFDFQRLGRELAVEHGGD